MLKRKNVSNCRTYKQNNSSTLRCDWSVHLIGKARSFKDTESQKVKNLQKVKNSKLSDTVKHILDTNQTLLVSTLIIEPPGTPWFSPSSSHQGSTQLTAGMRYSHSPRSVISLWARRTSAAASLMKERAKLSQMLITWFLDSVLHSLLSCTGRLAS